MNGNEPIGDTIAENTRTRHAVINKEDEHSNDLSGEAAGVVRGVSRSVFRAPWIGRLPQTAPRMPPPKSIPFPKSIPNSFPRVSPPVIPRPPATGGNAIGRGVFRQKVPIRQVAKVSDRMSTGFDIYQSALESNETSTTQATDTKIQSPSSRGHSSDYKQSLVRLGSFSSTLLRNTLLGMAVFESYGYLVASFAPPSESKLSQENLPSTLVITDAKTLPMQTRKSVGSNSTSPKSDYLRENDEVQHDDAAFGAHDKSDEYARASLPVHFGSGWVAGSIHGLATSFFDGNLTGNKTFWRFLLANTAHHALAHSMLFGSYESIKRVALREIHAVVEDRHSNHLRESRDTVVVGETPSTATPYLGASYLTAFGFAGGCSGSIQQIVSHYTEFLLGLSPNGRGGLGSLTKVPLPAVRPCLLAFPPSAIGFVAFEYGKTMVS